MKRTSHLFSVRGELLEVVTLSGDLAEWDKCPESSDKRWSIHKFDWRFFHATRVALPSNILVAAPAEK